MSEEIFNLTATPQFSGEFPEGMNKVVVTLNLGVDVDAFILEMSTIGNTTPHVPTRVVDIYNLKPESLRNVDFVMTRVEMEELKKDSRVLECRWGTKAENGIVMQPHAIAPSQTYTRSYDYNASNTDCNWGLVECINGNSNPFTSNNDTLTQTYNYTLDGTGVDIIIQDSGLQIDHPEFTDSNGNSRVQLINWNGGLTSVTSINKSTNTATFTHPSKSPAIPNGSQVYISGFYLVGAANPTALNTTYTYTATVTSTTSTTTTVQYSSTIPSTAGATSFVSGVVGYFPSGNVNGYPNFYTDTNGHGTNVGSIAAGKNYGWAKNANIYVMHVNLGTDTDGFDTSLSLNLIRSWHMSKPITSTGYRRPTIVNASWGSSFGLTSYITGGNYRGTPWTGSFPNNTVGAISPTAGGAPQITLPVQVTSTEADVVDCMNAGVIFVSSAGNNSYKADVSGGTDYDNYCTGTYLSSPFTWYYQRGGSPSATPNAICVGAIDYTYNGSFTGNAYATANAESKAFFSTTGPRIDVFAPGGLIAGAYSNTYATPTNGPVDYPFNTLFNAAKESGTSQASPQVTGALACVLQARPYMNQNDCQAWLRDNSVSKVQDLGANSYTNYFSLQGAAPRYLNMPYTGATPTTITNFSGTLYGTL